MHEIVVKHKNRLQDPFSRPRRVMDEIFICSPSHRIFPVGVIVPELVDVGIGLIGNTLAVAVDIDARKGSCLDSVF